MTAVVDGKHTVKSLSIQPEVVDPEDVEMLSDLVIAAVNEATRQAVETSEAEMGKITAASVCPACFKRIGDGIQRGAASADDRTTGEAAGHRPQIGPETRVLSAEPAG